MNVKNDFPIFGERQNLVYLDSAATSQKPNKVILAVVDWYTRLNSNVHRGIYDLSEEATAVYEGARKKVAKFIGAHDSSEIVFTGNASEAINLVAFGYGRKFLKKGDIVVISEMEHHSNIVPWMRLRDELGIRLVWLPINKNYELEYKSIISKLPKVKVKMVALTQASNVLGTVNPIEKIVKYLRRQKIGAVVLVDGAQSVPHIQVDVKKLGCDFLVFSGHKMLGPSGIGVLWGKKELLEKMDPMMVGSHMISEVTKDKAIFTEVPAKLEMGT
jgi:cysteine desulfurase / selenocysteine lyase